MADPNAFPYTPQTTFVDIPEAPLVGDIFEYEHLNSRVQRATIAKVTPVSQVVTILIGANNPGDLVGVTIDGGTVSVTAGASANATALLLEAALEGAAFIDVEATVNVATVTVTFADFLTHTVVEFSPDATTATVTVTVPAVNQEQLLYGMGVAKKAPTSLNNNCVVKPSSMSAVFAGVLFLRHGTNLPRDQIQAAGFDPDYLCPGYTYSSAVANMGIMAKYVGTAPAIGDPVYWIKTGADAGWWATSSGAVSQVTTGTVVPNVGDTVGLTIDSFPDVTVTSTAVAADTAVLIANAINARADLAAIVSATTNVADVILTFADDQAHTVVAVSPAVADVTPIVLTTAPVAANAELRSEYSWAKPSITSNPPRAFLRLSNP